METESLPNSRRPYLVHFLVLAVALGAARYMVDAPERRQGAGGSIPLFPPMSASFPAEPVPDFSSIQDTSERKAVFFGFLRPYVDQVNAEMLLQRSRINDLQAKVGAGLALSRSDKALIDELSSAFEVQPRRRYSAEHFSQLLLRIDVLPVSLVLAQAANESAWGTSRFALEGNNYFGQWCFEKGCGMVPGSRRSGAFHEVKSFVSVAESVRAYFMNLNTFPSYRKLRLIRQQLRRSGQSIDGISLSEGLDSYSERGQDYIDELQAMIYYNDLHQLDEMPQA